MKLNEKSDAAAKRRANKAFIAKLKTLSIGTGGKNSSPAFAKGPACPDCGEQLVPVGVLVRVVKQRPMFGRN